jgi:catechol 2,3-dioxygenase-like lactoylglutathione lyase family enzyme
MAMPARHFFHHVVVFASDFGASEPFYTQALGALGIELGHPSETGREYWVPDDDTPSFAVDTAETSADVTRGVHVAFEAVDRSAVDAFYEAAIAAGGTSRHEPRHWPEYRAYCAFVSDPDGNNIEALVKDDAAS